jgi:hypothetical protein
MYSEKRNVAFQRNENIALLKYRIRNIQEDGNFEEISTCKAARNLKIEEERKFFVG